MLKIAFRKSIYPLRNASDPVFSSAFEKIIANPLVPSKIFRQKALIGSLQHHNNIFAEQ